MISIDFVNDTIHDIECKSLLESYEELENKRFDEIDTIFSNFNSYEDRMVVEYDITDYIEPELITLYESERDNIFKKIGDVIIKIFNDFIHFIESIVDKIRIHIASRKVDIQTLDKAIKDQPDLKNQIIMSSETGALNIDNCKNLPELDKSFSEIIRMIDNDNIDESTMKGKWEKALAEFDKKNERDLRSMKAANIIKTTTGAVAAVLGLGVAIKEFPGVCAKAKQVCDQSRKSQAEAHNDLMRATRPLNRDDPNKISVRTGKFQTALAIWRELHGKHRQAIGHELSFLNRLSNALARFADRFVSQRSQITYHRNLHNNYQTPRRREARENRNTAYQQQLGRLDANREYNAAEARRAGQLTFYN